MHFGMRWLFFCAAFCLFLPSDLGAWPSEDLSSVPELKPARTSFAYRVRHASTVVPEHTFKALWFSSDDRNLPRVAVAEPIVVESGQTVRLPPTRNQLCSHAAAVAAEHDLPAPFFANLIQQESGFKSHVVSPAGAQGIAQFMPRVARAYGLDNPFDPIHSLSVSAKFLRELLGQFGNLGLAAAAYNAGPKRVQNWMARRGKLPEETRNYVRNITGQPAERWARVNAKMQEARLPAHARCPGMPVMAVSVPEAASVKLAKGTIKGKTNIVVADKVVDSAKTAIAEKSAGKSYTLASATAGKQIVLTARNGTIQIIAPERGGKAAAGKKPAAVAVAAKQPAKATKGALKVAANRAKGTTKIASKIAAKPVTKSAAKANDRPPVGKRVKIAAAGR